MTIRHDILTARLLGLLIIVTLIALAFQHYGPQRTLIVGGDATSYIEPIDDRENGGKSVATLTRDGDTFVLNCEIIASDYAWPYCEISFGLLDEQGKGRDLSNYEDVVLKAKYSAPQEFGIRFQLINFNPAYAKENDYNSLKYNSIELFKTHERYPQIIKMSQMQVPTWWLTQGQLEPEFWGPEFNEVRGVQISTGEMVKPGNYQMIIEGVELRGKYISDRSLYLGLLAFWLLAALLFFIDTLRKTKQELLANKLRQRQLEALNRLLNQEHKELEQRLTRDPLTGVLNREGLTPVFQQGLDSDATPVLSLMFIDIDHFKQVNDSYGHNLGDQVLLAFAQVLSTNTRTHDLLARWGGEEFVLACPETTLENAVALAEKLRRAIENQEWPKQLKITASFGVAQMMEGESPTEFIARADKALYVAKAQGRNCVRSSTHGPAHLVAVK